MKKRGDISISKHFVNDSMKLLSGNKKILNNIIEVCIDISQNYCDSIYYRHSLQGKLKGISDFQVTGDIRMFVLFEENNIRFLRIGTHSYLGI
ncbi:hypothetical protein MK079_01360 [Candidatus Gracilibacteria bacterium]|nr:hypothetical protein [Candidatus Gracilibacteria bacterium]